MKRALISVYDNEGILDFAGSLEKLGWEIICTSGTYNIIKGAGIDVIRVSDYTGSPEVLNGRIKTLHPKIFAGILAMDDQQGELDEYGTPRIDMVCCNLYPFKETIEKSKDECEILENIDIGGVALIRAAAKNYHNVIVVTDPQDYPDVIEKITSVAISSEDRKKYGLKAFTTTAEYDRVISSYFSGDTAGGDSEININLKKVMDLRYGENSHQKAALYGNVPFKKIRGIRELSFNNIQDINAAVNIVRSFDEPAAVIIKHSVPCGAASSSTVLDAYRRALESDSMSAFGGIIGLNRKLEKNLAEEIIKNFFEVIAAPDFSKDGLEILSQKKKLRVVKYHPFKEEQDMRKVSGGLLVQDSDTFAGEEWEVVTREKPTEEQMKDLKFAWKIVRFLKSNAVAIIRDSQTRGLGCGETSRVGAVNVAVSKLKQFFGEDEKNLVMASDAFFPFPDAVEEAVKAGVCAIVQPGGSKNDNNIIRRADELGVSMVFTGRRHFFH